MKLHRHLCLVLIAATAGLGGCASTDQLRERHPGPDARLEHMLAADSAARTAGSDCHEIGPARGHTIDCQRIQREVDRLYAEYPHNTRVMLANAVMHYESGRPESAQFLLDQLLAQPGAFPEAGILRARIALAEGNTTRARNVLEQQSVLAPDHADLREALASTYYLEGKYDAADEQIRIALLLGAPGWRADYHRGLLLEARGEPKLACAAYAGALQRRPDFPTALSRLIGLSAKDECDDRLRHYLEQHRP